MELQQALITAKAFFPEAYIESTKNNDGEFVYLKKDDDTILVSIKEPTGGFSEVCWCAFKHQCWQPVDALTEKQFVEQLRKWKETPMW